MIDFYYINNRNIFQKKIKHLTNDIDKLFALHSIEPNKIKSIFLDKKYGKHLSSDLWSKLNILYGTLGEIPKNKYPLLDKFRINKGANEVKKNTFIDLFAGAGGLSLGLEESGFHQIATNEINSNFLETYYLNREIDLSSLHCGDIKDFKSNKINQLKESKIDLIVGGPPCQGFSNANRQRLIDDPRNHLYKFFIEFIEMVQPNFFLMENVRGMLNKSDEIMDDFSSKLGNQYETTIFLLNAKEFGLPQHRERVFLLGTKYKDVEVNDIADELMGIEINSHTPLKQALHNLPKLGNKDKKGGYIENDIVGHKFTEHKDADVSSNSYLQIINKNRASILSNHMNRYNNPRDIEIFRRLPQGADSTHESIKDIMPYASRTGAFKDKYFKLRENHVSKTITAHMDRDCNSYIHPYEPRGLSPREAARIQSFPDDYVFMGPKNSWYTQIGNAVPPLLGKNIGETLIKYMS